MTTELEEVLFERPLPRRDGVWIAAEAPSASDEERQTSAAFSEKWLSLGDPAEGGEAWERFQRDWYLACYGYDDEAELARFLRTRRTILDAGCGPGHKAAWFARLAPEATVVAMDLSESAFVAARRYGELANLLVVRGDIAATPFRGGVFDFVSCDQVLHHTEAPPATVKEFARILAPDGVLNTYVYAKKALPRELLDEHFRDYAKRLSSYEIWALADQLTRLGRTLSELAVEIDVPDMPALGIKGGRQDLQRFVYWNFIKCFWNVEHGEDASRMINFDWYAPSTAYRYSREQFVELLAQGGFAAEFLRSEEACHTGRFRK